MSPVSLIRLLEGRCQAKLHIYECSHLPRRNLKNGKARRLEFSNSGVKNRIFSRSAWVSGWYMKYSGCNRKSRYGDYISKGIFHFLFGNGKEYWNWFSSVPCPYTARNCREYTAYLFIYFFLCILFIDKSC